MHSRYADKYLFFYCNIAVIFSDYQAIPELDVYEQDGMLDDDQYSEMSFAARQRAEQELAERDRVEGRLPGRLLYGDLLEEGDEEIGAARRRLRRAERAAAGLIEEEEEGPEAIDNLQDMKGRSAREHIQQPGTEVTVYQRFRQMLRTAQDSAGRPVFKERIKHMCEGNCIVLSFSLNIR